MDEELEQQLETARQVALDVDEGSKSRYWGHLKRKIHGLLEARQKYLDITNEKLLLDAEELNKRNQTVIERNFLRDILTINEVIIKENLAMIGAVRPTGFEKLKKTETFVNGK